MSDIGHLTFDMKKGGGRISEGVKNRGQTGEFPFSVKRVVEMQPVVERKGIHPSGPDFSHQDKKKGTATNLLAVPFFLPSLYWGG